MVQFRCRSCNYRLDSQNRPKKCPWCDSEDSLKEEQTAEDLIKELK